MPYYLSDCNKVEPVVYDTAHTSWNRNKNVRSHNDPKKLPVMELASYRSASLFFPRTLPLILLVILISKFEVSDNRSRDKTNMASTDRDILISGH